MDTLLIVITFLMMPILIIGLLVILEGRRGRIVKGVLKKTVEQLTKENQLLIVDIEFFRNKVIGIDRKNKKLVFAEYRKGPVAQFCIDLSSLSFCRVNKTIDKSSNSVKELFLEITCKDIYRKFRLPFYNRSFDNIRAKALLARKAEYWKTKINHYRRSVNFGNQFEYVL